MANLTFCEKTKFSTLCKVLEEIHQSKDRDRKTEIMRKFITSFREQSKVHENDSFYPILRLLLPDLDNERGAYGIKEFSLANSYIRILVLTKTGKDGLKLLNYRAPKSSTTDSADFAEVAYWVIKSRCLGNGSLNIHQVNEHLDNIVTKHAEKNPRGVDDELKIMIREMPAFEQKWLIRILLKNLHIGLSHGRILGLFHPDAKDLFDVTNNLQKVCTTLKDPSIRLNEIEINIFEPFKPMLSQRCDVEAVEADIKKADFYYVEIKFDGERFQIHHQNGEFKYFSRGGHDYTNTYGCNSSNGILTPKLVECLSPTVASCILDGEMMCWNTNLKCYTTKGMNIDVKLLKIGHVNQPCFCVFDIVYLNGQVLTNKPLSERVQILEEIIQPCEGVFMISFRETVKTSTEILNLLKLTIDNCEEGIVVKEPSSVYKPNSRNAGWYKIKPEYTEGLMVELDVLIIGGYYGVGRKRGRISQFLFSVADSKKNEGNEPCQFYSLGRVGSGFTDVELAELDRRLQAHWNRVKPNEMPPGIKWTKEKPDLWIKPEVSVILQVKATEVIPSDSFKVGYTLRFPRIQKIRYDKPWSDCLTLDEFTRIRQSSSGKLTADYVVKLSASQPKRMIKRTKKVLTLGEEYLPKKTKNMQMLSNLFENREFCVLTGLDEILTKSELEKKIIENGGTITQHPGEETYCIIASEETVRVSNAKRQDKYNIVKPQWVLDCIGREVLRKWRPDDFLSMAPDTAQQLSEEYDCYGDSYKDPIDLDRLKFLLNSMKLDETSKINVNDMIELDRQMFQGENPYAMFRGCYTYFCGYKEDFDYQGDIYKSLFRFYGGLDQRTIDESCTHIITFSNELPSNLKRTVNKNVFVIDKAWISDSCDVNSRLDELKYSVRHSFVR